MDITKIKREVVDDTCSLGAASAVQEDIDIGPTIIQPRVYCDISCVKSENSPASESTALIDIDQANTPADSRLTGECASSERPPIVSETSSEEPQAKKQPTAQESGAKPENATEVTPELCKDTRPQTNPDELVVVVIVQEEGQGSQLKDSEPAASRASMNAQNKVPLVLLERTPHAESLIGRVNNHPSLHNLQGSIVHRYRRTQEPAVEEESREVMSDVSGGDVEIVEEQYEHTGRTDAQAAPSSVSYIERHKVLRVVLERSARAESLVRGLDRQEYKNLARSSDHLSTTVPSQLEKTANATRKKFVVIKFVHLLYEGTHYGCVPYSWIESRAGNKVRVRHPSKVELRTAKRIENEELPFKHWSLHDAVILLETDYHSNGIQYIKLLYDTPPTVQQNKTHSNKHHEGTIDITQPIEGHSYAKNLTEKSQLVTELMADKIHFDMPIKTSLDTRNRNRDEKLSRKRYFLQTERTEMYSKRRRMQSKPEECARETELHPFATNTLTFNQPKQSHSPSPGPVSSTNALLDHIPTTSSFQDYTGNEDVSHKSATVSSKVSNIKSTNRTINYKPGEKNHKSHNDSVRNTVNVVANERQSLLKSPSQITSSNFIESSRNIINKLSNIINSQQKRTTRYTEEIVSSTSEISSDLNSNHNYEACNRAATKITSPGSSVSSHLPSQALPENEVRQMEEQQLIKLRASMAMAAEILDQFISLKRDEKLPTPVKEINSPLARKRDEERIVKEQVRPASTDFYESDPKDSKWTLKYSSPGPGIVELMPNTGVYVNEDELTNCKRVSKDCKGLARKLLRITFTNEALRTCSLTGAKYHRAGRTTPTRPGLDTNARNAILNYTREHQKVTNWVETDIRLLKATLTNTLNDIKKQIKR